MNPVGMDSNQYELVLGFFFFKHIYLLFSRSVVSDSLQPHGLQHARLPCPSLFPGVCSNSYIESVMPSNHLILLPPSPLAVNLSQHQVFTMGRLLTSGDQCIGPSASALSMNIQGWFPLGLIGLISLLSKGLSRISSSTTIWKHQCFGAQPSLQSTSYIHTWLLEKP